MEYKIEVGLRQNYFKRKDISSKGDPPIESQVSEWTALLSKLLLRGQPRCGWIQNQPQITMVYV